MLVRREIFAKRIVIDRDRPADAYRFAYGHFTMSDSEADDRAGKLLQVPEVSELIGRKTAVMEFKAEATGEMAVERMWQIANADPAELIGLTVGCCRHCWGVGNNRQWTIIEYREALKDAEKELKLLQAIDPAAVVEMPDLAGGLGYNRTVEPNPDCPHCNGVGQHYARPIDTRDLSPTARMLFNGVKQKADGSLEILMQDRGKHLEMFGRARGVFIDRVRHEGTISLHAAVARAADPHEAMQAYQDLVKAPLPQLALPPPDDSA